MKTVAVLGAGLVGGLIARDLANGPSLAVVSVDASDDALSALKRIPRITTRRADLTDPSAVQAAT